MIQYGLHETLPQPAGPVLVERTIVERMADKMREMAMNGIAVTAGSLAEHSDFTRAQIEEHGPDAADLAKSLSVTRIS